jgi:hypothetical protein
LKDADQRHMLWSFLVTSVFGWASLKAHRLIQFQTNSTNGTMFGSAKVAMDHEIARDDSAPNSAHAVFIPLKSANLSTVSTHLNSTSPVIFVVDRSDRLDTTELEDFLISTTHKAPIYFTYDSPTMLSEFTHVKTSEAKSNSAVKRTKLQNVIGVLNSSSSLEKERIAVISVPFDSFSVAPSAGIGANTNGLSIVAWMEIIHQISKFPLTNNWVFVFALTDGRFCHFSGLDKAVASLNSAHAQKVQFGISLESISATKLNGLFGQRLKRDTPFAKFMLCLKDSMKAAGIPLETSVSEEPRSQSIFSKHLIPSIAIANENLDDTSRITDTEPDIDRANAIVWAVTEALLRMMYDAADSAVILDRVTIDASRWAKIIAKVPRVPAFRDQTLSHVIGQWIRKFATLLTEEWTSSQCYAPFSSTSATLVLYTPTPISPWVLCFVGAIVYGVGVFVLLAGVKGVKKLFT